MFCLTSILAASFQPAHGSQMLPVQLYRYDSCFCTQLSFTTPGEIIMARAEQPARTADREPDSLT
ncbi:hypothetical protein E6H20_09065 [Candidatus Bathyarchaeota archaeon]|nr:MAG: hypothetical protein E6H20_09065 [Candidatus Bathyarchaeota archaeon]